MVRSITTWEKGQDIDVQKSTHSYQPFITQSPFHLWTKLDHCSHVNQVAGSNNWVKLSPSGLGLPLQLSQGDQLVPQLQLSLHKLLVTGSNALLLEILPYPCRSCRQCRPPPGAASAGAASAPELLPSHISHYLFFLIFFKIPETQLTPAFPASSTCGACLSLGCFWCNSCACGHRAKLAESSRGKK